MFQSNRDIPGYGTDMSLVMFVLLCRCVAGMVENLKANSNSLFHVMLCKDDMSCHDEEKMIKCYDA